jgi:ADP-ribose pyrophosphatase YjhB (NUDIX family)
MSFIKLTAEELRRHKGISFTGITTVFFCHDGRGKLFLTKRSARTRDEHGRWDSGAGGLKHGQAVEDNLRREVLEEYNVEPIETEFIGYLDAFRSTPEDLSTHWLAMCFAVKVDPDKVKINEPEMVDDSGWFTLDALPSPLHSQFNKFMEISNGKLKSILTVNS